MGRSLPASPWTWYQVEHGSQPFGNGLQVQDKLLVWCESLPVHLVYLCTNLSHVWHAWVGSTLQHPSTHTHTHTHTYIYIYIYIYIYVAGCSGTLHKLVGSHTKVVVYPTITIHCESCDPCLIQYWVKGIKVANCLVDYQTTKFVITKGVQKQVWAWADR